MEKYFINKNEGVPYSALTSERHTIEFKEMIRKKENKAMFIMSKIRQI